MERWREGNGVEAKGMSEGVSLSFESWMREGVGSVVKLNYRLEFCA